MGKILYKGPLSGLFSGDTGDTRALLDAYDGRRRDILDGMPEEEIDAKWNPVIDKICYPNGHPVKKKAEFDKWYSSFEIVGKSPSNLTLRGGAKRPYARIFIEWKDRVRFNRDMTIDVLLNPKYYPPGQTLTLTTELMDMITELYGPSEIEVDYDPFNKNFCIFKKQGEDNDRGFQVDGQKEEERV